jgi:large subunit ribosomal protein L24
VQQGGILDIAMPLAINKVMVICPACSRPTRMRHEQAADGRSVRVCSHCSEPVTPLEKKRK